MTVSAGEHDSVSGSIKGPAVVHPLRTLPELQDDAAAAKTKDWKYAREPERGAGSL